ncbi:DNA-directed RNA polymerase I, II, and III subunit RPABC5 [Puccinia sorghi]|uniref:DNA-directed RNA polymerases I, II, and III subunit RPABC5 n=1 Tax=Puccinia sorghi TaxID=27349 RepID=A0A0L6UZT7_9BASI|nr:DNA-directed RNA polymerase I, II, and III subunit RPABC5 [Puccinia sorghi]
MDAIGLKRYCCRRMVLTHVDLIEKLLQYNRNKIFPINPAIVASQTPQLILGHLISSLREAVRAGVNFCPLPSMIDWTPASKHQGLTGSWSGAIASTFLAVPANPSAMKVDSA